MIVLGIAALILAGVLIAVPALQRNQRNNNRRADISYVQAQLTAYQGSNQNELPETVATVTNGVTNNDDESAYYSANDDWTDATNWSLEEPVAGTPSADGAATEYNLWVDTGDAASNTANETDPGVGAAGASGGDPLPDEEHFDIFIGYSCAAASIPLPANTTYTGANYPNGGDAETPTAAPAGAVANIFVHEDGRARDFAIVYRLEGEDVYVGRGQWSLSG